MSRTIIGMTGRRGSPQTGYVQAQAGKDTAAIRLIDGHGFVKIALADGVRDSLYALDPLVVGKPDARFRLSIELAHLHRDDEKRAWRLSSIIEAVGWEEAKKIPEVRALMQRMGTEAGRAVHGEDLWTDLVEHKISKLEASTPVVVTDVRFPNEESWLRGIGGVVVEVYRPQELAGDLGANAAHASETMGWIKPDFTLTNDGTVEDLHRQVDLLLEQIQS